MELKIRNAFIIIFFTCILSGCALLPDTSRLDGQEAFEASVDDFNAIDIELKHFVGKHKDELQKKMGKPTKIIAPSIWQNIKYDEEWVYSTGVMFINKQYRTFYIKDDVVVHTEFGGMY